MPAAAFSLYRISSSNNRRPHPSGVRPSSAIRRRSTAQPSPADSAAGDTGGQPGSMSRNSCRRSARAFCASIPSPTSVTAAISRRRYRSGHRLQATFPLNRAVMEPTSRSSSRIAAATVARYSLRARGSGASGADFSQAYPPLKTRCRIESRFCGKRRPIYLAVLDPDGGRDRRHSSKNQRDRR